ncbi:MAG: hypothetical protein PVH11_01175 [Anaerolineae bacterium]|jgi:hypothetical protein
MRQANGTRESRSWIIILGLGLALEACLAGIGLLGDLRRHTVPFLILYFLSFVPYAIAVWWSLRQGDQRRMLITLWAMALLFRITLLLATPPTLSDDLYRYIWDGRLANAGISPYAYPVDSPLLDAFDSPQRDLVNNSWMASPYLPVAQGFFAAVYRLAPDNPFAFQVAALLFDLLTGGLVVLLLGRMRLPRLRVLIYLWNPLILVEFAHGAHLDALMLALTLVGLWVLIAKGSRWLSAVALAAATLTKGLPALLVPVLARRWGWRNVLLFAALFVLVSTPFAMDAGWGLAGPLDGTGLFGAFRIYSAYWNYNGGLYHWLEILLSGYSTPGAVPPEIVGWAPIRAAKLISLAALAGVLIAVWWRCRRCEDDLTLLRLAPLPVAAYMLLAPTVHPWYVALIIPLLPFLPPRKGEATRSGRFLVPALYFSAAVALSYLTYLDPENLREYTAVRIVEYVPLYVMLIWAAWPRGGTGALGRSGRG